MISRAGQKLLRRETVARARRMFRRRASWQPTSRSLRVPAVIGRLPDTPVGSAARAMAQAAPQTLTVVRHRAQPIAVFITRLTATAALAYLFALLLPVSPRPVIAPLTALLVVQVTMYHTIRSALQRVVSVVVGVLVAVAFSVAVGFTWWSLAIVIAAGLVFGYGLRLGDHILEVPITAMLILSLATRAAATSRILETLVGAGAGLIGGLVFSPLRVQPAEEAMADLSRDLAGLLDALATDLGSAGTGTASSRLSAARALSREIRDVDRALAESEESLRLNPRGRSRPHVGVALRDGLETLEHAAVTVRGITRSVADAASLDGGPVGDDESRQQLAMALHQLAGAVCDFGELVRADIMTGGGGPELRRRVEADLLGRLSEARHHQEVLDERLRTAPAAEGPGWPLRGELLTHVSRLHDELQPENRARARERWPRPGTGWPGRLRATRLNPRQLRRTPGPDGGGEPLGTLHVPPPTPAHAAGKRPAGRSVPPGD